MKLAPFSYFRPESIEETCLLLQEYGDDARILAGGQSLVATLNMRLSAPQVLIDINRIGELSGIAEQQDSLRIGALTRQVELERSPLIAERLPLLTRAMPYIAHAAIRNRGTLGGSIALADPAAELPACALALQANLVIRNAGGERTVAADDFFRGLYETALQPDELLLAVEFPLSGTGIQPLFMEFSRRHGDYAMAGIAGSAVIEQKSIKSARLVFFGVGDRPLLATGAAALIVGRGWDDETCVQAQQALAAELDPIADLQASETMKKHLAGVLLKRSFAELMQ